MRLDVGKDRVAFEKAVRGRMCRDEVEDIGENLALQVLEPDLGCFDESDIAVRLPEDDGLVVSKGGLR